MVRLLDSRPVFPPPGDADEHGLLAVGGDLSVERLVVAYRHGIFPWFAFRRGVPCWYCPKQRFVILPHEVHVSHSMRSLINRRRYSVTFNKAFDRVIAGCSQLRIGDRYAWLGPDMIEAYTALHRRGLASSVEVWDGDGNLVGGLYGVIFNRCFMGESMFSLASGASKLALIELARWMAAHDWGLIDCQFETPHLRSLGGRHISYREYIGILHRDLAFPEALEKDFSADLLYL